MLLLAFGAICVEAGTLWPWTSVVHEDGMRTLLGTIFYFEHAARELPLDVLLGMAVAGGMLRRHPPVAEPGMHMAEQQRWARRYLLLTIVTIGIIVVGTLLVGGIRALSENLLQLHTRDGVVAIWGRHWRYHLLERLAMLCLAVACARILPFSGRSPTHIASFLVVASFAAFGVLSLFFELSWEPFRSPVFLAHQARELFTHLLVTLPLALGVCAWLGDRVSPPVLPAAAQHTDFLARIFGVIGVVFGLYLIAGTLVTAGYVDGQTHNMVSLVFAHIFEHSFTYLLVPLVAGSCYLAAGLPRTR